MAPKTPIVFASMFEKQKGTDGNMYCAEMENGNMAWRQCQDNSKVNHSTDFANRRPENAYDTYQRGGVEYIAENKGGCLDWVSNDFKNNVKNTSVSFVVLPRRA